MKIAAWASALLASLVAADMAQAYPRVLFESEPNDRPEQAQSFRGEMRLVGEVRGQDVDMFWWALDDTESDRFWTLELTSMNHSALRAELTFGETQPAEKQETLSMAMETTRRSPAVSRQRLIVPPGEHLITLTATGDGGDYQLSLVADRRIRIRQSIAPDDETDLSVTPGREQFYHLGVSEYSVKLDTGEDAEHLWAVSLLGELGSELETQIIDADGQTLTRTATGSPLQHHWRGVELPAESRVVITRTDGDPIGRIAIGLETDGQRDIEREPGDDEQPALGRRLDEAIWIDIAESFETRLAARQRQYLAFRIPEQDIPTAWNIEVADSEGAGIEVCLGELGGRSPVCRTAGEVPLFSQLQLEQREYFLRLRTSRRGPDYNDVTVRFEPTPLPGPERAVAPNDDRDWAAALPLGEDLHGHIRSDSSVWFELLVDQPGQLWEILAEGEDLSQIRLYSAGERRHFLASPGRRGRAGPDYLRMDHLELLPGRYHLRLYGDDTDYRISARPMHEASANLEAEPNDSASQANRLRLGRPMRGTFHDTADSDWLHFSLPGWNQVAFHLEPPAGGDLSAALHWGGERSMRTRLLDQPTCFSRWLPAGDHYLELQTDQYSSNPWQVRLELLDPWSNCGDPVPAQTRSQARLLPEDGKLSTGMGAGHAGSGYFRLPVAEGDREIRLGGRLGRVEVELVNEDGATLTIEDTDERNVHVATIPAGQTWYLRYDLDRPGNPELHIEDPAAGSEITAASVAARLEADTTVLAGYHPMAQQVSTRLTISDLNGDGGEYAIQAQASHLGTEVDALPDAVTLSPGQTRHLDLTWTLPPGLGEETPVHLHVLIGETAASQMLSVEAGADAPSPLVVHDIPVHLQGLTNLAWKALGAEFADAETGQAPVEFPGRRNNHEHFLLDGLAAGGSSLEWGADMGEPLPPIRLAGDGGIVHAVAFNQRSRHAPGSRWREVEIALGDSVTDLVAVGRFELEAHDRLQVLELDQPTSARFVRIRPLSQWDPDARGRTGTGLFMALGEPGGEMAGRHHNLLDGELGGHWVYTLPDASRTQEFPHSRHVRRGIRMRGDSVDVVYAFLNHRAARLKRLRWLDPADGERRGEPVQRMHVHASTETPVGPWESLGSWDIEPDADGWAEFDLDNKPWARYLRLQIEVPPEGEGRRGNLWRAPLAIEVIEAETLASRGSILGGWGMDGQEGPYETAREDSGGAVHPEDLDSSAASPWPLTQSVTGRVGRPGDARHYRIALQEPDNTLAFSLSESLRGRLVTQLTGPDGNPVALNWSEREGSRHASAVALPPGDYYLEVREPPRSIAFIWDGSGSIANMQPAIYRAIRRFAKGLLPGEEVANLMALGGPFLLHDWAENPIEIQHALAAYDNRFDSSDSEPALQTASRALEAREGERAIFLITDAELMGRELSVWHDLARVRPRIFALETNHGSRVDSAENRWYQNLMKAWANVGDGSYSYSTGRVDLIRNFENAMRQLRQPTTFALSVDSSYQEPPQPGTLEVVSGEMPVVAAGVVHLIFDASGSMLRRMEGGRRIDVAKRIVREILDERIPEHVPVALRAYGHTEPHSCETELLVPPSADNHARVRSAIDTIQAINLARTPLAASLDEVLTDLADFEDQRRLVVMLTDGEETCDGDVSASVERVIDEGVNVRLNIVGFHIDEIGLQTEFERFADLGGGEYFDSQDGEELIEGLRAALAASFRVLDLAGEHVATGRVDGEPLSLDPGRYEVVVETDRGDIRRSINVRPESSASITLDEAP